jgi:hypothetical protein
VEVTFHTNLFHSGSHPFVYMCQSSVFIWVCMCMYS